MGTSSTSFKSTQTVTSLSTRKTSGAVMTYVGLQNYMRTKFSVEQCTQQMAQKAIIRVNFSNSPQSKQSIPFAIESEIFFKKVIFLSHRFKLEFYHNHKTFYIKPLVVKVLGTLYYLLMRPNIVRVRTTAHLFIFKQPVGAKL